MMNRVCIHLGEFVREHHCDECPGNTRIKVYACSHPERTPETILLFCLTQCEDRMPPSLFPDSPPR